MKKRRHGKKKIEPTREERWRVVQVASFLGLSPQTARNRMLQKVYGPSEYNARTRTLTVAASAVRAVAATPELLKNTKEKS